MSEVLFTRHARLNDALERELLNRAIRDGEAGSVSGLLVSLANVAKKGLTAFWNYMVDLSEALAEARAQDARYSGAQW